MLKATTLKPRDVLAACKLFSYGEARNGGAWTYASLAEDICTSPSEAHRSVERCRQAQLLVVVRNKEIISRRYFHELLSVATPRIFFAHRGSITVGMPTGLFAPPLAGHNEFPLPMDALPTIWTDSEGAVRGESIEPLHPSVPEVAKRDVLVYELLALVDIIRIGDTPSRNKAIAMLERKIIGKSSDETR